MPSRRDEIVDHVIADIVQGARWAVVSWARRSWGRSTGAPVSRAVAGLGTPIELSRRRSEEPPLTARIRRRHTTAALSAVQAHRGTDGSNPALSSAESAANLTPARHGRDAASAEIVPTALNTNICIAGLRMETVHLIGDAARTRDRLLLAGVGLAAFSVAAPSGLDAGRDLGVRLAFWFAAAAGVGAGSTSVVDFRPKPRAFAMVERRSEYAGAVRR